MEVQTWGLQELQNKKKLKIKFETVYLDMEWIKNAFSGIVGAASISVGKKK